jgi:DNA-directed RNA polymerase specialized sigma24 family protein
MTVTADTWTPEQYAFLYEKAEIVARGVSRDYPDSDRDDLTQEALMWAVEHPGKIASWLEHDEGIGRVVVAMKKACRRSAVKQRALARGDETFIDDCWYSTEMLKGFGRGSGQRGLLHLVFDDDAWTNPEATGDSPGVRTKKDPAEGNNWLATLSDVSAALDKLSREDPKAWSLLVLHYKQQYTYDEIGAALTPPVSKQRVLDRIDRAVRKVQDLLGGPKPQKDPAEPGWEDGPGSRYVLSNAAARAITDNQYED